mgnify:CR=1 FL=1
MPLLVEACPSYAERFRRYLADNYDAGDERLPYCELGDLVSHLCDQLEKRDTSEFADVFRVVERLHVDGDSYVKEAATIGLLEGIQNVASHCDTISPDQFETYLGTVSRRWWHELNAFWQGKRKHLGEGLEKSENEPPAGPAT